jgi:nucleoside-diphosphate-sugar epimerase
LTGPASVSALAAVLRIGRQIGAARRVAERTVARQSIAAAVETGPVAAGRGVAVASVTVVAVVVARRVGAAGEWPADEDESDEGRENSALHPWTVPTDARSQALRREKRTTRVRVLTRVDEHGHPDETTKRDRGVRCDSFFSTPGLAPQAPRPSLADWGRCGDVPVSFDIVETAVLLTGITGFVGGALAARLVSRGHRLLALVRGHSVEHARRRVVSALGRFLAPSVAVDALGFVDVLVGDLVEARTYAALRPEMVTHVVHAAACTSFSPRTEISRTNVDGTRTLAEHLFAAPNLRRFLHVSTAYCCGDRPNPIVCEDDAPSPSHGHVNEYARSKANAELLLTSMGWNHRLLIARPSVVIGHTRLGVRPSSSLFWYYRAMATLRCGPFDLDDLRDVVPVDYAADALAFLLELERPRFGVYHVSAGSSAAVPLRTIVHALSKTDDPWRKIRASEFADLADRIGRLVHDDEHARKLARGLAACAKFGELGVRYFDNARLLSEGFPAPPRFTDYLDVCARTSAAMSLFEMMIDDA